MFKFEVIASCRISLFMNCVVLRKFIYGVTLLAILPGGLLAQDISMEQTLDYINGKLGSGYQVDVNHGVIIARFSEGTEVYREDQVLYKTLDMNTMTYDKNQRLFIINCKSKKECVDRQLFVKKIQRDYARISFPVTLDEKGVEGMKRAFKHMIHLIDNPKSESTEPFEP